MFRYQLHCKSINAENYIYSDLPGYNFQLKPRPQYIHRGFLLYKKNELVLDMEHGALILGENTYQGHNSNGSNNWGVVNTYSSNSTTIEIEVFPPCPFPWRMKYILGYINGKKMFLVRSKNRKKVVFTGSNLLIDQLCSDSAPLAMAYLCAYILYNDQ